ncbi:hypothetical protein Tco_1490275, partial [Tanacetum coccineum]
TAGRTMELVLEQPEAESTEVLAPTPLHSVPGATEEPLRLDATSAGSSEDADVAGAEHRLRRKPRMRHPRLLLRSVEATSDSQASPLTADDISRRDRETGPKAFEGMPVDQLMEEFDMVTAQQAALVAQLRARFSSERSQSVQKDEEILLLKTQLAVQSKVVVTASRLSSLCKLIVFVCVGKFCLIKLMVLL